MSDADTATATPDLTWRDAFHEGFAPALSVRELQALRQGLAAGDGRLLHGGTCVPPPMSDLHGQPVLEACAVAFAGWQGSGLDTVGVLAMWFYDVFEGARYRLAKNGEDGSAAACLLTNWWDDADPATARAELLVEVDLALSRRPRL